MKVVFQSNSGPFALSRRSLAAAASVLPDRIIRRISKLVVVGESVGPEPFEFDRKKRVAQLCIPGDPHDAQARDRALRELLLGLARLDLNPEFQTSLTDGQRITLQAFADEWHPRCLKAIAEAGIRPRPPHERRLVY